MGVFHELGGWDAGVFRAPDAFAPATACGATDRFLSGLGAGT